MLRNSFREHSPTLFEVYRMVVSFRDMREVCLSRTSCNGCPYFSQSILNQSELDNMLSLCNRVSTDDVLDIAAETFRAILADNPT
jgi:hypothetical protein